MVPRDITEDTGPLIPLEDKYVRLAGHRAPAMCLPGSRITMLVHMDSEDWTQGFMPTRPVLS